MSCPLSSRFDLPAVISSLARLSPPPATVALQLPDALLPLSGDLVTSLRSCFSASSAAPCAVCGPLCPAPVWRGAPPRLCVLGDTSFSPCCVDEVAAAHISAGCAIVHFGHACLSPPVSTPTVYVFDKSPCDAQRVGQGVLSALAAGEGTVALLPDPALLWALNRVLDVVAGGVGGGGADAPVCDRDWPATTENPFPGRLLLPSFSRLADPASPRPPHDLVVGGYGYTLPPGVGREAVRLLVVSGESPPPDDPLGWSGGRLRGLAGGRGEAASSQLLLLGADGASPPAPLPPAAVSRLLSGRYGGVLAVQRAADLGLLSGTLGVARHTAVLDAVAAGAAAAGKSVYRFLVGKLSPSKLANFGEIDAWVLVACPEASLPDWRGAGFYKPIVTPYEALVGCGVAPWGGSTPTDFETVLGAAPPPQPVDPPPVGDATLVHVPDGSRALTAFGSAAGERFAARSWRGLAYDPPGGGESTTPLQGLSGRAAGYSREGEGQA